MITLYGTTRHGEGYVMKLGEYECVEDIVIQAGMFGNDIELSFTEEDDEIEDKDFCVMTTGEK